jgi:hypothetical protein
MLLEITEDLETIHSGHLQVEQEQIDLAILEVLDGRLAVAGFVNVIPLAAQIVGQSHAFHGRVIAQQQQRDRSGGHADGVGLFHDSNCPALLPALATGKIEKDGMLVVGPAGEG